MAPPSHRLTALSPLAPEGAGVADLNIAETVGCKLPFGEQLRTECA